MNHQKPISSIDPYLLLFNDNNYFHMRPQKKYIQDIATNYTNYTDLDKDNKLSPIKQNELIPDRINKILLKNNIKYGIDESGNPINIKDYYKSINDSVNLNSNSSIFSGITTMNSKAKRPIAYITKDENGNNMLIDLKGNKITTKNRDGDYDFPLELHVVIKDFDVKHPELRVNGERSYKDDINDNIDMITNDIKGKDNEIILNENLNDINDNNILNEEELYNINGLMDMKENINEDKNLFKYDNFSLFDINNNKLDMKANDILSHITNSSSQDYIINKTSLNNTNYNNNNSDMKNFIKNRSFRGKILNKNKPPNLLSFKYKKDLYDCYKAEQELNNKKKIIKPSLSIDNFSICINKKSGDYAKKKKKYRNKTDEGIFHEKLNTETNRRYAYLNDYFPKIIKSKNILNTNQINNKKHRNDLEDKKENNLFETLSHNYFIIKPDKSYDDSKLFKKNKAKAKIPHRMNNKTINSGVSLMNNGMKSSNITTIDSKNNMKLKDIKKKLNNSISTKNQIKSQKLKKIDIPKKEKEREINIKSNHYSNMNNKIHNTTVIEKYFVLSEEANDMIKSYSKKKKSTTNSYINKNKKDESFEHPHIRKNSNNKYRKLLCNNNNFNNSNYSINNMNNYKKIENCKNICKENLDKNNDHYFGLALSLPVDQKENINNNSKQFKATNTSGSQININVTPYELKYHPLIRNNTNSQYNYNVNDLKVKNKYKTKKKRYKNSQNCEIFL